MYAECGFHPLVAADFMRRKHLRGPVVGDPKLPPVRFMSLCCCWNFGALLDTIQVHARSGGQSL